MKNLRIITIWIILFMAYRAYPQTAVNGCSLDVGNNVVLGQDACPTGSSDPAALTSDRFIPLYGKNVCFSDVSGPQGNVGIGLCSPAAKLDVLRSMSGEANPTGLQVTNSDVDNGTGTAQYGCQITANGAKSNTTTFAGYFTAANTLASHNIAVFGAANSAGADKNKGGLFNSANATYKNWGVQGDAVGGLETKGAHLTATGGSSVLGATTAYGVDAAASGSDNDFGGYFVATNSNGGLATGVSSQASGSTGNFAYGVNAQASGGDDNYGYYGIATTGNTAYGGYFAATSNSGGHSLGVVGQANSSGPDINKGGIFNSANATTKNWGVEGNAIGGTETEGADLTATGTAGGGSTAYGVNAAASGSDNNYGGYFFAGGTSGGSTFGLNAEGDGGDNAYGGWFMASGGANYNVGIYASNRNTGDPTNPNVDQGGGGLGAADCAAIFDGDALTTQTGVFAVSDERLKTSIAKFENGIALLNKLETKSYSFKTDEYKNSMNLPTGIQIGIMAQNLQSVFPNLVKEKIMPSHRDTKTHKSLGPDTKFLAVNYTGLIPVLVQAVKELDAKTIENQQMTQKVADLESKYAQLQNQLNDICNSGCAGLKGSGSNDVMTTPANQLLQNVPNPFSQETTIGYVLNTGVTAYLNINGLDGKLIKHIDLVTKGHGSVTINGNELSAGTYTYSLYVDGNVIDTKLMVISASK